MTTKRIPPVKLGEQLLLKIIGKDSEKHPNDRIAKVDSYIIFIKDCCEDVGERINVEITAALPKYAFAKVNEDFGE